MKRDNGEGDSIKYVQVIINLTWWKDQRNSIAY